MKLVGPIDSGTGRGDSPHTWIKGSPPPPIVQTAEKWVGPIDFKNNRPGPVLMQVAGPGFQKKKVRVTRVRIKKNFYNRIIPKKDDLLI
jgi:nucleoid-associated protein YgaU